MRLASWGARAEWPATYCLSIDNHISGEAPCSSAASAWEITTMSLLIWALSLQTNQRSNTNPQQRTAPNNSTPTHSLKKENVEKIVLRSGTGPSAWGKSQFSKGLFKFSRPILYLPTLLSLCCRCTGHHQDEGHQYSLGQSGFFG